MVVHTYILLLQYSFRGKVFYSAMVIPTKLLNTHQNSCCGENVSCHWNATPACSLKKAFHSIIAMIHWSFNLSLARRTRNLTCQQFRSYSGYPLPSGQVTSQASPHNGRRFIHQLSTRDQSFRITAPRGNYAEREILLLSTPSTALFFQKCRGTRA